MTHDPMHRYELAKAQQRDVWQDAEMDRQAKAAARQTPLPSVPLLRGVWQALLAVGLWLKTLVFLTLFVIVLSVLAGCSEEVPPISAAPKATTGELSVSRVPVFTFGAPLQVIPGALSTLTRTDTGIKVQLHTLLLPADTVVTVGWLIFNRPQFCKAGSPTGSRCGLRDLENPAVLGSVIYAAGRAIGRQGTGNFSAQIKLGDAENILSGPGLVDPARATIDLLLVSEGKIIPDHFQEQIGSFSTDCSLNPCLQFAEHTAA